MLTKFRLPPQHVDDNDDGRRRCACAALSPSSLNVSCRSLPGNVAARLLHSAKSPGHAIVVFVVIVDVLAVLVLRVVTDIVVGVSLCT